MVIRRGEGRGVDDVYVHSATRYGVASRVVSARAGWFAAQRPSLRARASPSRGTKRSSAKASDGKSRMESPSDWPVAGLLVHAAGQGESGFRVVDVWESEEACNRFGQ